MEDDEITEDQGNAEGENTIALQHGSEQSSESADQHIVETDSLNQTNQNNTETASQEVVSIGAAPITQEKDAFARVANLVIIPLVLLALLPLGWRILKRRMAEKRLAATAAASEVVSAVETTQRVPEPQTVPELQRVPEPQAQHVSELQRVPELQAQHVSEPQRVSEPQHVSEPQRAQEPLQAVEVPALQPYETEAFDLNDLAMELREAMASQPPVPPVLQPLPTAELDHVIETAKQIG